MRDVPLVLEIRRLRSPEEAEACAALMAGSEPWITLGRTYDEALALMTGAEGEVYVAVDGGRVLGFIIIVMTGAFAGYIRSIAVAHETRGQGIGTRLLGFAEARIHEDSPNVFLCVSSFNPRARALYEQLGYEMVGELKDYVVRGHSELLMRKSIGPLGEFHAGRAAAGARDAPPARREDGRDRASGDSRTDEVSDAGGPAKPA